LKLKFAIPAAVIALGLVAAASPAHAVTVKQIRQSDFIAALKDTRSAGHFEFLSEGLHVWTDDATSNAKVAEYFPVTGALPATSKMDWLGVDIVGVRPQPGVQIVFDVDGTTGNGNDYNILVGEPVYGTDASGNVTDWWLTTGSSAAAKAAAPLTTGGSGSGWHGSLSQWKAALPSARMLAGGFSLGSGALNNGVIRSITYGDTEYVFTDTPAVVTKDVTGTVTSKVRKNLKAKVTLTTDKLPTGITQGKALTWTIKVDGKIVASFDQNAGQVSRFAFSFKKHTGTHKVDVLKNGAKDVTIKVKTNKA
jgi:hypothetical protein